MVNKIYPILFLLFVAYSTQSQDKLNVVSSCSIFKDMAFNIAGDHINLESIVPIGGDPHLHTPRPRDARIVANADLILINGMTFEGWIEELIENSGTKGKTVMITEGVSPIGSSVYENSVDPHAWMNAENGLIYINNIKQALIAADPKNKESYQSNFDTYSKQLTDAHNTMLGYISKIPAGQRTLVTSHDAFSYFGKAYGLDVEPIIGVSTEADVQTSDMIRVSKVINEKNIPAVFVESTINPKILQQIAKDNDVVVGGELYADSLGEPSSEGGTYLGMLLHNAKTISNALAKTRTKVEKEKSSNNNSKFLKAGLMILGGLLFLFLAILSFKRNSNA